MRNSDHAITDTYAYDAFGNTLASSGGTDNPYRYVGGLGYRTGGGEAVQLGARYFTPSLARFAQRDPLHMSTYLGFPDDPASLNAFTYCHANPMRYADPSGEELISVGIACCIVLLIGGGVKVYCGAVTEKCNQRVKDDQDEKYAHCTGGFNHPHACSPEQDYSGDRRHASCSDCCRAHFGAERNTRNDRVGRPKPPPNMGNFSYNQCTQACNRAGVQ